MATDVMPVVTLPNTAEGILSYLVKRTDDTIGEQVDRADVVVLGHVATYEARTVPVQSKHVATMKPWLSGEAGRGTTIFLHVTTIQVERWLIGPADTDQLDIAYVYSPTVVPGGPDSVPVFHAEDRGLLFLKKVRREMPYASYVPDPAYHLAEGETGVRNFLLTDYDEKGQSFVRDETAGIEETVAAVQWYDSLSKEKCELLYRALVQALDSPNPHIGRYAIRALARGGEPNTSKALAGKLAGAGQDLKVRLMLGLWLLGEREAAANLLEGFFQAQAKYAWLEAWEVRPTVMEREEPVETLYGPDPSRLKGD
jgi:hypothetical protein